MITLTEKQKNKLSQIGRRYQLKLAVLFGSQVEGRIHGKSDYDVALLGKDPEMLRRKYGALVGDFAEVFNVGIDRIDISFIDSANSLLLNAMNQNPNLLYGSQYDFDTFSMYCYKRYIDYKPYFEQEDKTVGEYIARYAQ